MTIREAIALVCAAVGGGCLVVAAVLHAGPAAGFAVGGVLLLAMGLLLGYGDAAEVAPALEGELADDDDTAVVLVRRGDERVS